jgi:hypothetical protein
MDIPSHWTVDQLAASNLLAALNVEATTERLELATRHIARHRQDQIGWAAERMHMRLIDMLEKISTQSFARESEEFTHGFRYAEQHIMTLNPQELLEIAPERPRTQGQILRAMVRQARRD